MVLSLYYENGSAIFILYACVPKGNHVVFYRQPQASRTRGVLLTTFVLIIPPGRMHEPPPTYVSQLFTASLAETGRNRSVLEDDRDRIRPRTPPLRDPPRKAHYTAIFSSKNQAYLCKKNEIIRIFHAGEQHFLSRAYQLVPPGEMEPGMSPERA